MMKTVADMVAVAMNINIDIIHNTNTILFVILFINSPSHFIKYFDT